MAVAMLAWSALASAATGLWQTPGHFVDEANNRSPLSAWASDLTVVAMEYTECKFVCTVNWRRLTEIQAEADRRKLKLQFLLISLDPEHDTPAAWRDYRKVRGIARDNWHFVTGDRKTTNLLASRLGVKWWYFNDSIMHDFRVLLVDSTGKTIAVMERFDDSVPQFLDHGIGRLSQR